MRLGDPILRRTGAVGVEHGPLPQALITQDLAGQAAGLAQGEVVADARRGDRLLGAVGVDVDPRDGGVDAGAELQGELVLHQHHVLRRLTHHEAAVGSEGPASTPVVGLALAEAVDLEQLRILRQRAHGPIALQHLGDHRRLGGPHHGQIHYARLDLVHSLLEVVEEGGAGADEAGGATDAADHVSVDEVGGHLRQAEGAVARAGVLASHGVGEHAAGAHGIELTHGARGVDRDAVGGHVLEQPAPADPHAAHGVGGAIDRQLQPARVVLGPVARGRLKARGDGGGRPDGRSVIVGHQQGGRLDQAHLHPPAVEPTRGPAGGQLVG